MSKFELFKMLIAEYEKIKGTGKVWFYKEDEIAAILKPYGAQYTGFIIKGKMIYNFIFHSGDSKFVHTIIRKNNSHIKISGIRSINSFTYIHNLSYMSLVTMCGNTRDNTEFWENLFSNY